MKIDSPDTAAARKVERLKGSDFFRATYLRRESKIFTDKRPRISSSFARRNLNCFIFPSGRRSCLTFGNLFFSITRDIALLINISFHFKSTITEHDFAQEKELAVLYNRTGDYPIRRSIYAYIYVRDLSRQLAR